MEPYDARVDDIADEILTGIGAGLPVGKIRAAIAARARNEEEGLSWPMYDSVPMLVAGSTNLQFFQVPIGQGGKTQLDTNMRAAGLIQQGRYYDVYSIGFGFQNSAAVALLPADAREIVDTGFLTFSIQDREVFSARLNMLPYGGGLTGVGTLAAGVVEFAASGIPDHRVRYQMKRKIRIPRNVNFVVTCQWPVAVTPAVQLNAIVWLDGVLWRPRA
jgi:hypothetical protein